MPKKPQIEHPLVQIRRILGMSQERFAARFRVTASSIKKIEGRNRTITQELTGKIYAVTGAWVLETPTGPQLVSSDDEPYTAENYKAWKADFSSNIAMVRQKAAKIKKWIELLFTAVEPPKSDRALEVYHDLMQTLHRISTELGLQKHIDDELRRRHSTEIKKYRVDELRKNPMLAEMTQFKDDPKLKPDAEVVLQIPVGWIPGRETHMILSANVDLVKQPGKIGQTPKSKLRSEEAEHFVKLKVESQKPNPKNPPARAERLAKVDKALKSLR